MGTRASYRSAYRTLNPTEYFGASYQQTVAAISNVPTVVPINLGAFAHNATRYTSTPVTVASAVGDCLIFFATTSTITTPRIAQVQDTAGNVYQNASFFVVSTVSSAELWFCPNANALHVGDTIWFSMSSAADQVSFILFKTSELGPNAYCSSSGTGASGSATSTNLTTGSVPANSIAFGVAATSTGFGAYTESTGWTTDNSVLNVHIATKLVGAGTVNYHPSWITNTTFISTAVVLSPGGTSEVGVASLTTQFLKGQVLSATAASSLSLARSMTKAISGTAADVASLVKQVTHPLFTPAIFGTPVQQGIKQQSGVTSVTVTTVSDIHTSDVIVITHETGTTGRLINTIVDPLANVYQVAQSSGVSTVNEQFYARSTGLIAAGSTITINFTGGTATHGVVALSCPMEANATLAVLTGTTSAWASTNVTGAFSLGGLPSISAMYVLLMGASTTFGSQPSQIGTAILNFLNGTNATSPMWVFAGINYGGASVTASASWASNNSGRAMLLAYYGYYPASPSLVRMVGKQVTTTSVAGITLAKQLTKSLTAATAIGVASLVKSALKILTLATAGDSASLSRSVLQTTSATAGSSPSLVKQVNKFLTVTAIGVATLIAARTGTVFFQTVSTTSTGVASLTRTITHTLTATASSAASLVRSALKALTTTAGSSASLSETKVKLVTLTATAGSAATITRAITHALAGVAGSVASIVRAVRHAVSPASAVGGASVTKQANKTLSSTGGGSASLSTARVAGQIVSAVAGSATSLAKRATKALSAAASQTTTLSKAVVKALSGALAGSAAFLTASGQLSHTLSAVAGSVPSLLAKRETILKLLTTTAGSVTSLSRAVVKPLVVVAVAVPSIAKRVTKTLAATAGSIVSLLVIPPLGRFINLRYFRVGWARLRTVLGLADPWSVVAVERLRSIFDPLRSPRHVVAPERNRTIILNTSYLMSQANPLLPPIDSTQEREIVTFDFGLLLPQGATVTSIIAVTCANALNSQAQDPTPTSRLIGSAQIVQGPPPPTGSGVPNCAVAQLVGTMIGGVTYVLQCVVATSSGEQKSLWAHLPCVSPN